MLPVNNAHQAAGLATFLRYGKPEAAEISGRTVVFGHSGESGLMSDQ